MENIHSALVDAFPVLRRHVSTRGGGASELRFDVQSTSALCVFENLALIPNPLPAATTGQKTLQRLVPFGDDYSFVLFGTSVGIMLVYRDCWRLNRPNQSSIWTI